MKINVLDHGSIELLRTDGDDDFLAQTARTSTDTSASRSKNAGLVNRLVRDRHTSPIEFGSFVFEIMMPIFVARQWMRHRTGSFNEFSMRYSEAPDVFYIPEPERCQKQSTFNKQGSAEVLSEGAAQSVRDIIEMHSKNSMAAYDTLREIGLTRELSRIVLPTNIYTKVRWKIDLHNLMGFLKLRDDSHAQYEIRVYAEAIHKMVSEKFPVAMRAYEEHVKNKIEVSPSLAKKLAEAAMSHDMSSELRDFVVKQLGENHAVSKS